jgi:hypothetical protein
MDGTSMSVLKGILYPSGNVDFPRSENEWAFARLKRLRSHQENRIIMHPEVVPIELSRSPELDPAESPWLDELAEVINACSTVNLQLRESALRLRKAVCDIDQLAKLVVLASQEAVDDFASRQWRRIAYFYAKRHDVFRFDMATMISVKDGEPPRQGRMELLARVVHVPDDRVPRVTFDATGPHADVHIVEWRGHVPEGETGLFNDPDLEIRLSVSQVRQPLVFLYERRPEFRNHAYTFFGEKLDKPLRRALKRAAQRSMPE